MNTATAAIALVLALLLVKFMPGSKWASSRPSSTSSERHI